MSSLMLSCTNRVWETGLIESSLQWHMKIWRMNCMKRLGSPLRKAPEKSSGFAWSPDTKMWTAKPELWKALAKSKPDAKKWMITRIANYDMLVMLFAKDREKRKGAKRGQLGCSIGGRVFDGIPLQEVVGARSLKSIREAIKDVVEAIREGNVIAERGQPRVYSEQELFAELVNLGHIFSLLQTLGPLFGCTAEERKEFLLQMMHNSSGDLAY
ncbi:hypothetical protein Golob_010592 [Gossypium lobatum]|uniref:Uncharacterized protein n=1 Tax=Gossypium lobatum TaxID=34289 RepID=A0A7J8MMD5_9ROSI|nr:hypothetical protein [Gossypium lobatum]